MRRSKTPISILAVAMIITGSFLMLHLALAGDLEPSAPPTSGTMNTLQEIYNIVTDTNTKVTQVPCTGAPVEKTGQKDPYAAGDDGDLEKGSDWPDPRFTDNGDGTVTDNLTGLIWLKNANCFGQRNWATALTDSNSLANGSCGLTDGSAAGDWRLPNVKELQSLIDYGTYNVALPAGYPFTDVQSSYYWSATTFADFTSGAWTVTMSYGSVTYTDKTEVIYVLPVRDDN